MININDFFFFVNEMCIEGKKKIEKGSYFLALYYGINIFVDALLDSNLTIQIKYRIDLIIKKNLE